MFANLTYLYSSKLNLGHKLGTMLDDVVGFGAGLARPCGNKHTPRSGAGLAAVVSFDEQGGCSDVSALPRVDLPWPLPAGTFQPSNASRFDFTAHSQWVSYVASTPGPAVFHLAGNEFARKHPPIDGEFAPTGAFFRAQLWRHRPWVRERLASGCLSLAQDRSGGAVAADSRPLTVIMHIRRGDVSKRRPEFTKSGRFITVRAA